MLVLRLFSLNTNFAFTHDLIANLWTKFRDHDDELSRFILNICHCACATCIFDFYSIRTWLILLLKFVNLDLPRLLLRRTRRPGNQWHRKRWTKRQRITCNRLAYQLIPQKFCIIINLLYVALLFCHVLSLPSLKFSPRKQNVIYSCFILIYLIASLCFKLFNAKFHSHKRRCVKLWLLH